MRNQLLGFAVAIGAVACVTETVPDELADESGDADGKSDAGDGAFTYWRAKPAGTGTGYTVSRANRTVREEVTSLDFSNTAFPNSVAKGHEDRIRAGEAILLRGELISDLSKTAGPAIAAADLVPTLPPTAPSIHVGDADGPDCLYARLFVQDIDIADAKITVTPTTGGAFLFDARFGGVSIPSKSEFAMACVNGTATITTHIATLTASGVMTVATDGTIAFPAIQYRFDGISHDSATLPPAPVQEMLFGNQIAIGDIVMSSVGIALEPLAKIDLHKRTLAVTEVWLPGSTDAVDLSGVFVFATQAGDKVLEQRLNSTTSASIDELDLAASGANEDALDRAAAGLAGGDGVLLVGYRYKHGAKRGRSANQFWTKAPVPQF